MKGCRPLTRREIKAALAVKAPARDHALIALGFATGYRISELLSIRLQDVVDARGRVLPSVYVRHTKGGGGRGVPLNSSARKALKRLVSEMLKAGKPLHFPLFGGRVGRGRKAICRQMANRIIKRLFEQARVVGGRLASHSMRKTFASLMRDRFSGDYQKIQKALGHQSITSTMSYLPVDEDEIYAAIAGLEY